ncbi:MAG: sensor histidine kinase [Elainella sp.]
MSFLQPSDSIDSATSISAEQSQHQRPVACHLARLQALETANQELRFIVTQQQQTEAALQQQNQMLREQLQQLQATQTQIIQTEKMTSLGQLVAGIAHEINNPINFIHGNLNPAKHYIADLLDLLHLYQKTFPPTPQIQQQIETIDLEFLEADLPKLLNSITVGSNRIREIVRALRTFARLDEAELKLADIHEGLDSTLFILKNRLKSKSHQEIKVIKEYGKLPPVECYSGQLNQVFLNILNNAIDALEEKFNRAAAKAEPTGDLDLPQPSLTIATAVVETESGPGIEITVADNGIGMTADIKQRIFDPFFTTKSIGKGTGLGLSISYQIIVDRHRGHLQCCSTPGQGSRMLIQIPLAGLTRDRS